MEVRRDCLARDSAMRPLQHEPEVDADGLSWFYTGDTDGKRSGAAVGAELRPNIVTTDDWSSGYVLMANGTRHAVEKRPVGTRHLKVVR